MNRIVSTIAFKPGTVESMLPTGEEFDFVVEFSSAGFPHTQKNWETYHAYTGNKLLHNYFPGYETGSFVLNLASQDEAILEKSINHCLKCIEETRDHASLKMYAVHAGFLFDISPAEIGKPISNINPGDFEKYQNTFYQSMELLIAHARKSGVKILLENNVLIKENYHGELPFFCIESKGIDGVFERFSKEVEHFGLLLDTAHLKVSCETLGLDLSEEFKRIRPHIQALHHSDNDALYDTNEVFDSNYWFLDFMDEELRKMPHTLEAKSMNIKKINESFNLLGL